MLSLFCQMPNYNLFTQQQDMLEEMNSSTKYLQDIDSEQKTIQR
jgi:hypothetical protein